MKSLALDTSSVACSVAAQVDERTVSRYEEQPREHTRLLMPMIREVIEESGLALAEFDAIVLGNGPGSFIGMRIAASVAQGLAHGAGLAIIPVSSLAAVAAQVMAQNDAQQVVVAQDAHMNEVYLGIFARDSDGLPAATSPERLHAQSVIVDLPRGSVPAGEGWQRYPKLAALNASALSGNAQVLYPDARFLLRMAANVEAIRPDAIAPAYLRQRVAQLPADSGR